MMSQSDVGMTSPQLSVTCLYSELMFVNTWCCSMTPVLLSSMSSCPGCGVSSVLCLVANVTVEYAAVPQGCMLCRGRCSHQGCSLKTTPCSSQQRAFSAPSHTAEGAAAVPASSNPVCLHEPCHPCQAAAGSQQAAGPVHQGVPQPPGRHSWYVCQAHCWQACLQERQSCSPT